MIYAKVFGLVYTDLDFSNQIKNFKKVLGEEGFYKKIKDHYEEKLKVLPDTIFEKRNWSVMIEDNSLKSIWVKNIGVIEIEETPDMRVLLLPLLKKTFKKLHVSTQLEMMHAEIH
jgi:hypothetical protein